MVCALHPSGVNSKNSPYLKQDPELEGQNYFIRDLLGIGEPIEVNDFTALNRHLQKYSNAYPNYL